MQITAGLGADIHRIPIDPPGVLRAAGCEADLIAIELAVADLRRVGAVFERSRNHLKRLLQRQLSLRQFPRAFHFGWHDPEIGRTPIGASFAGIYGFVRLPLSHIKRI